MKIDLKEILGELGLPVALIIVFTGILALFGMQLDGILHIVEGLVGTFAMIAVLINVLKWIGVVTDGTAGQWSAALNLVVVITAAAYGLWIPAWSYTIRRAGMQSVKYTTR